MTVFYITCPSKKVAGQVGQALLKARLAACYNLFPVESGYWWKGKIVKERGFVLIVKTLEKLTRKVESLVKKIHPDKMPCIISLDVDSVNQEYRKWVVETTLRGSRRLTKQSR